MEIKGKLLCGIAGVVLFDLSGMPLGGLVGFVVGSYVGHYLFDLPKARKEEESEFRAYQKRQGQFFYHVFTLCAKMAKADAPVNRQEVSHMEYLMRNQFRMNDRGRAQAIRVWKQAKDSTEPFDQFARAFYQDFGRERHHVNNMLDLLFAMAACDGPLHPREEELLLRAAGVFQISRLQYERIKGRYYHTRSSSSAGSQQRWSPLDPHYAILGAQPTDSLDLIKKKYRALAMEWHPDKVAGKGLSAEAMRHAKEKFQQINEAYEKITEARK